MKLWAVIGFLAVIGCTPQPSASEPGPSLGDTGQHKGDVVIDGIETFSGQVTGDLIVLGTGNLTLNGQVIGDLIVAADGRA